VSSRGAGLLIASVLAFGIGLRIGLTAALPPRLAYDDHFTHILKVVQERRLPRPEECWQCYQPPLYYVIAAVTYSAADRFTGGRGTPPLTTPGSPTPSIVEQQADVVARKAVQCISTVAGSLTLLVCWRILRRLRPKATGPVALGLAVIAVLPQHVYMSAMVTNDALTYLLASLAILATVRAHAAGWPLKSCVAAGALCGAAVLSKAYGLVTAAAVWSACAAALCAAAARNLRSPLTRRRCTAKQPTKDRRRPTPDRESNQADANSPTQPVTLRPRRALAALVLLVTTTPAVGIWPSVRNLALYGRPQVDNFQNFTTGMQSQPPGSIDAIEFFTFRYFSLLRRPWLHASHLQSFWTELFGRYWFEYEGAITLRESPEWAAHRNRALQQHGGWTRPAWNAILDWTAINVPPGLHNVAVVSYMAGLPLTLLVLGGAIMAAKRWREFGSVLLLLHWAACLFVPFYQVLRIPFFAAMKSAFTLSALSSAAFFVVLAIDALPGRGRTAAAALGWASVILVGAADIAYIALMA
jgi:hypothetical protein